MNDVYRADILAHRDEFEFAGEGFTRHIISLMRSDSLEFTSGTAITHPDSGTKVSVGFSNVTLDMVRRFPELGSIEQIEVVCIGPHVRVFTIPPH